MLTSKLSLTTAPGAGKPNRLDHWTDALAAPEEPPLLVVLKDRAAAPGSSAVKLDVVKVLVLAIATALDDESKSGSRRGPGINLRDEVQRFEATLIKSALTHTGGRQRRAAHFLGMNVSTLNAKIKRYQLDSAAEKIS